MHLHVLFYANLKFESTAFDNFVKFLVPNRAQNGMAQDLDLFINDMNEDPFEKYVAAAFSIRCSYHQTHDHSPAQLVFGRDVFMPLDAEIN